MLRQAWLYLLQNTQFVVTSLTAYFILRIRTAHSLYFGAGTLVAAFSAKLLKKCIRQPRPVGAKKYQKTYGMPSTHSSSIAFFGTYLSLSSLLLPLHPRVTALLPFYDKFSSLASSTLAGAAQPSSSSSSSSSFMSTHLLSSFPQRATRITLAAFFLAGAGSVCWSRVRLGHHTRAQVLVGAGLGSFVALVWMSLWLGPHGVSALTGWDLLLRLRGGGGGVVGRAVPGWVVRGVKEEAMVWERAAEDACWVVMEAWRDGRWEGLRELRRFPVLGGAAGGEL